MHVSENSPLNMKKYDLKSIILNHNIQGRLKTLRGPRLNKIRRPQYKCTILICSASKLTQIWCGGELQYSLKKKSNKDYFLRPTLNH